MILVVRFGRTGVFQCVSRDPNSNLRLKFFFHRCTVWGHVMQLPLCEIKSNEMRQIHLTCNFWNRDRKLGICRILV